VAVPHGASGTASGGALIGMAATGGGTAAAAASAAAAATATATFFIGILECTERSLEMLAAEIANDPLGCSGSNRSGVAGVGPTADNDDGGGRRGDGNDGGDGDNRVRTSAGEESKGAENRLLRGAGGPVEDASGGVAAAAAAAAAARSAAVVNRNDVSELVLQPGDERTDITGARAWADARESDDERDRETATERCTEDGRLRQERDKNREERERDRDRDPDGPGRPLQAGQRAVSSSHPPPCLIGSCRLSPPSARMWLHFRGWHNR
jgi:hypothetical protein